MNRLNCKRTLSLLLILASLIGVSGCANPQNEVKTTDTAAVSESAPGVETELMPDLPHFDGGGGNLTILAKMESNMTGKWTGNDIIAEEMNGEVVNDAVYNRNIELEGRYNIKIKAEYMDMGGAYSYSMYKGLSQLAMAGDQTYDIITPTIQDAALLARDGLLYDLNKIGNVDLNKPWWSAQFNEDVNIGGKSYYANGDICMTFIRASYCVLFNKDSIAGYSLDDPYGLVRDGKWTMDKMLEMASAYASNIDGNDVYDLNDNVGLGVLSNHVEVFYAASGGKLVTYDKNAGFAFTGGSERSINALENILKIFGKKDAVINFGTKVDVAASTFQAGRMLLLAGTMHNVPRMRDMDTDFGILPYPKYDEAQDKYYTYVQTWASSCAAIPMTCADPLMSSIILEDMAYGSYKQVTPAYFETALKAKYTRDDESQEILDMICEGRTCDLGNIFNVGGMLSALTSNINNGEGNFASLIASKQSGIEETLKGITELYS